MSIPKTERRASSAFLNQTLAADNLDGQISDRFPNSAAGVKHKRWFVIDERGGF
jgi:hypothetical protein